jgi:flagellin
LLDLINQDSSGNFTASVTDAGITQKTTDAIGELADGRSILGGVSSRLDLTAQSLTAESQNNTSALSRIQDVDVAAESTRLAKFNVLAQSGTAMLSQANQSPQAVLRLLQSLQS